MKQIDVLEMRRGDMVDQASVQQLVTMDAVTASYAAPHVQEWRAERAFLAAYQGQIPSRNCSDCKEEIPEARRKARPFAERCRGCQENYEKKK